MVFIVVLLTLLWSFQVVFFEEIYKKVKISEIERSADMFSKNVELDSSELNTLAGAIAVDRNVCVMVYDQGGNILVSKHFVNDCSIHAMNDMSLITLYVNAQMNGGEKLTRFPIIDQRSVNYSTEYRGSNPTGSSEAGESMILTKVAYSESRAKNVVMIFNATISPVSSTVKTLQTELVIISVLMLAAAAIMSYFIAKRIATPIVRINSGAKELASGNYDVKLERGGYREVSELSDTLTFAAQELSKTGALQRELIANISHDLRTPLTMIEGYSEVMRDIPGEMTPENIQIIIDETKRLTSLVTDLLDISKLQSGTQQLELSDFNLTETVREVIGRFSKLTEQDGWVIDLAAAEEVMVRADRTRILQVIYNFINNAITHSGEEKLVTVTQRIVEREDGAKAVRIEVTDRGEGIPEENLASIWDRYYKADKTHKRAKMGSGLGLSIVKGILELHSARYGVISKLGEGSTFWFEL